METINRNLMLILFYDEHTNPFSLAFRWLGGEHRHNEPWNKTKPKYVTAVQSIFTCLDGHTAPK